MLNGSKSQQTGDMKSGRVQCITVATTIITEVNVHIMHSMTAPGLRTVVMFDSTHFSSSIVIIADNNTSYCFIVILNIFLNDTKRGEICVSYKCIIGNVLPLPNILENPASVSSRDTFV